MKKDTHPTFHEKTIATCSCGASFEVGSTEENIKVELCSNCHPFYTGEQKIVDTARCVEKFKAKEAKLKEVGIDKKGKTAKRAAKAAVRAAKVKKVKEEDNVKSVKKKTTKK